VIGAHAKQKGGAHIAPRQHVEKPRHTFNGAAKRIDIHLECDSGHAML
jgi:hypothetical protein